jgi:hypothetical protein
LKLRFRRYSASAMALVSVWVTPDAECAR